MFETLGIILGVIIVLTGLFLLLIAIYLLIFWSLPYLHLPGWMPHPFWIGIISIAMGVIAIILFIVL